MKVHRITHILTFDTRDFKRYEDIQVLNAVNLHGMVATSRAS